MAQLRITVDHDLSEQEAIAKLKQLWEQRPPESPPATALWDGNVMTFSGVYNDRKWQGTMTVGHRTLLFKAEVPWYLKLFEGLLAKQIREGIRKQLS